MSPIPRQRQDEFERTTMFDDVPGARRRMAYIIRCSQCSETEKISLPHNAPMPPDEAAKRFNAKGWNTAKGRRDRDYCPDCAKAHNKRPALVEAVPVSQPQTHLAIVPASPPPAETPPPAPMTRDDRRLIFAKLNDVYLDERTGYGEGWSDGKVAGDLGVPAPWVRAIREENFGPEVSGEQIQSLVEQAKALNTASRQIQAEFERMRSDFTQLEAKALSVVAEAEKANRDLARVLKQTGIE